MGSGRNTTLVFAGLAMLMVIAVVQATVPPPGATRRVIRTTKRDGNGTPPTRRTTARPATNNPGTPRTVPHTPPHPATTTHGSNIRCIYREYTAGAVGPSTTAGANTRVEVQKICHCGQYIIHCPYTSKDCYANGLCSDTIVNSIDDDEGTDADNGGVIDVGFPGR